jgi:Iodothyronine deiodinase
LGTLHEIWERYAEHVAFAVVYIREAHPEEGWVVTPNRAEGIRVNDPSTTDERVELAATCALRLTIRMPVVVDPVEDEIARAYGALPDRLYLIGRGGKVAFQGEPGPFGFDPSPLEKAIRRELGLA